MRSQCIFFVIVLVTLIFAQDGTERILPKSNLCDLIFSTGYETFDEYTSKGYSIVPPLKSNSDLSSTDTVNKVSLALQDKIVHSGARALQASADDYYDDADHAAYPIIQFSKSSSTIAQFSPIYVEIFVYLDAAVTVFANLATFSSDDRNTRTVQVNVGPDMKPTLYGVPFQYGTTTTYRNTDYVLPTNQWVNMTVYLDFDPTFGVAAVWFDGNLVSVGSVMNGNGGVYNVFFGMQNSRWQIAKTYNDDLKIWSVGQMCNGVGATAKKDKLKKQTTSDASTMAKNAAFSVIVALTIAALAF